MRLSVSASARTTRAPFSAKNPDSIAGLDTKLIASIPNNSASSSIINSIILIIMLFGLLLIGQPAAGLLRFHLLHTPE